MNAEQLAGWLQNNLTKNAFGKNLNSDSIAVKHVLNWGGFVNQSFTITDGSVRYHLKLANHTDSLSRFENWRKLHHILENRYRTPELVDWVDFSEIGFSGLAFRHVDGMTADFCRNLTLIPQLIATATRLHHDEEIQSHLAMREARKTRFNHFVETYIQRFTSDLAAIRSDPPPFVSSTLLTWMHDQTDQLRDAAERISSFHEAAIEPIHGDLHEGNILICGNDWFIIDWDDLSLGDPAIEFAVLLWPLVYRTNHLWQDFLKSTTDDGFAERLELCFRAQLLDEIIDTLADYVEAHTVPSNQGWVEEVKKKQHQEALRRWHKSEASGLREEPYDENV